MNNIIANNEHENDVSVDELIAQLIALESSKKNDMALVIANMLRVNHAGEYGAKRIYQAQLKVLGNDPIIQEMADQEQIHLKAFENLLIKYNIRPTVFQPLWHSLSYALGLVTSLMGPQAAHACTIAVEEVIDQHYTEQLNQLKTYNKNPNASDNFEQTLALLIKKFQDDELHHKQMSIDNGGTSAKHFKIISKIVKGITKTAIKLSTRI